MKQLTYNDIEIPGIGNMKLKSLIMQWHTYFLYDDYDPTVTYCGSTERQFFWSINYWYNNAYRWFHTQRTYLQNTCCEKKSSFHNHVAYLKVTIYIEYVQSNILFSHKYFYITYSHFCRYIPWNLQLLPFTTKHLFR